MPSHQCAATAIKNKGTAWKTAQGYVCTACKNHAALDHAKDAYCTCETEGCSHTNMSPEQSERLGLPSHQCAARAIKNKGLAWKIAEGYVCTACKNLSLIHI